MYFPRLMRVSAVLCLVVAASSANGQTIIHVDDAVPEGLTGSDWKIIRQAYEQNRHAAVAVDGEFRARNPGQQWLTHFDGRGFTVEPTIAGVEPNGAGWRWGLELQSYGFPGHQRAISGQAKMTAQNDRVTYDWHAGLREWFVNDRSGLEHGFTLVSRPPGAGNQLELRLAVLGGLLAQRNADGQGVSFVNQQGRAVASYAGLKVWDADNRVLPARIDADTTGLRLSVDEHGARYPLTIALIAQQAYLKASNTDADDHFGFSVAVSGDTVVVGATGEDSSATGVNGNQANNSASASGAAYVFVRDSSGVWSQQAYLKASNTGAGDSFGESVAVSGDTVVVGAWSEDSNATGVNGNQADNSFSFSGAAYVFVRDGGGVWSQQAYLKASNTEANDEFGFSVGVSGDTVVVGARSEDSNATGVNGNQADNGRFGAGAAYVFVRDGASIWSQQAYLKASNTEHRDLFGFSVAVSGDTVVVGAEGERSNATGVGGNQGDNSASSSGAAYVFVRDGTGIWSQQAYLKASNTESFDLFGWSVAVSGDTVVVGAFQEGSNATGINGNQADNSAANSGAAYVFVRDSGGVWSQQAYLKASNTEAYEEFGRSVAVSGDTVVIAAWLEDSNATGVNGNQSDNNTVLSGAAYVFVRDSGGVWTQQAYLKASNTDRFDGFGFSVAVSGDTVIVGAIKEASNAMGVNGDQADNSASLSGAAYVFALPPDCNANSIPDACDLDCGLQGGVCDVNGCGLSADGNGDSIPDECQRPPQVLFVDDGGNPVNTCTSWGDACPDLQTALGMAIAGDEIWVAVGTYAPAGPGGDRTATFQLLSGVPIYGGFAGSESTLEERAGLFDQTILSGDLSSDDEPVLCESSTPACDLHGRLCLNGECLIKEGAGENSYHVVTGSGVDATAILDGFTITGGFASGPLTTDAVGGGMYNYFGSPTVVNCTFIENTAMDLSASNLLGAGGGMFNEGGNLTVDHCTFSRNVSLGGGGMLNFMNTATVRNCTFADNFSTGMINLESVVTVNHCSFRDNYSYGMVSGDSTVTVRNCIFDGNIGVGLGATGGSLVVNVCSFDGNVGYGMFIGRAPAIVDRCVFTRNYYGMWNLESDSRVSNTAFVQNRVAGMQNQDSSPTVDNCVFNGNSGIEGSPFGSIGVGMWNQNSSPAVSNCTFSANTAIADAHLPSIGGGMINDLGSSPAVSNCTFSENGIAGTAHFMSLGGGIIDGGASMTVSNCVFWGNSPNEIVTAGLFGLSGGALTIAHSDVRGGLPAGTIDGGGNIDTDPLFVDPDGPDNTPGTADDDLRLGCGSPCIDAGDNVAVPIGLTGDLFGNPRFIDDPTTVDTGAGFAPIVDMGAHEYAVDCNDNNVFDAADIDSGFSQDCNSNDIPDECTCEFDCNDNGIPDECDITDGTSDDCTGNGTPDECEPDCNENGVADSCDIGDGTSGDCSGNGIPDECEPDCNGNGAADSCDIADSTSVDCTGNDIPDECEPDCNGNGAADSCDIADGTSQDCDDNAVPDSCDIANGTNADCTRNGIPDACEPDCNFNAAADSCEIADGTSLDCNGNGIPDECEPDCNGNGAADSCDIADGTSEDCTADGIPDECEPDCNGNGSADSCDIDGGTSLDCTANGIPDECEPDCNGNGSADSCEIADGTSDDCNRNMVPDSCDVADGTSQDCNTNGVLDDCEHDCNGNGAADSCDIADGTSADCNSNGIPDECEPDCNGNGDADSCDITDSTSADCNSNGIPDECEPDCNGNGAADSCDIVDGTSRDCTANGIPDECEPDCNTNGSADSCDIADGTSEDCSGNGIPDECDSDCNTNGTADSCDIADGTSQDCNINAVPDECDIDAGASDNNGNGVPDTCELFADFDFSGTVDLGDARILGECMIGPTVMVNPFDPCARTDLNGDGFVDLGDVAFFMRLFGASP